MDKRRTARRTKSLEVEPIDDTRFRFRLSLEDKSFTDDGEELIHSLRIDGELSIPDLVVLSIEPVAIHHPYAECGASLAPFRALIGARIGTGFRAAVLEAMGRERGCTHFMTLALDLGAAHTLSTFLRMSAKASYSQRNSSDGEWMRAGLAIEPRLENACVALRTGMPVIENARKSMAPLRTDMTVEDGRKPLTNDDKS